MRAESGGVGRGWMCNPHGGAMGKLRDPTAQGGHACSAEGPETKAVLHIQQTYNPTVLSSPSVHSKPKHLVGHSSDAQRHPQKDLMSQGHRGLKQVSYHMLSTAHVGVTCQLQRQNRSKAIPLWAVISPLSP